MALEAKLAYDDRGHPLVTWWHDILKQEPGNIARLGVALLVNGRRMHFLSIRFAFAASDAPAVTIVGPETHIAAGDRVKVVTVVGGFTLHEGTVGDAEVEVLLNPAPGERITDVLGRLVKTDGRASDEF